MKMLMKVLFAVILVMGGIVAISATRSDKPATRQSATYYYYPKVNMYYDVANGVYIYLDKDGKTWQSAKQVTDRLTSGMGKKAVLNNPPLPVWKGNAHHRMVYSTSLYASANDFKKEPQKPETARVTKPVVAKKVEEQKKDEKKESGIERFFNRLFKKKDKKEEKTSR